MVRFLHCVAFLSVVCLGAASVNATEWQHDSGSPGDWFEPANWTDGLPSLTNSAFIGNGGTAQITGGSAAAGALTLGLSPNGADGTGTLDQNGGTLNIGNDLNIGWGNSGTYNLSGDSRLTIGDQLGTGNFLLTRGTFNLEDGVVIANGTQGKVQGMVNQNGGSFTMLTNETIFTIDSAGQYNMTGGTFSTVGVAVGYADGEGAFHQHGGEVNVGGLSVGSYWNYGSMNGSGSYLLDQDGVLHAGEMYIGNNKDGSFVQNGGTVLTEHGMNLGTDSAAGHYTLTAGTITAVPYVSTDGKTYRAANIVIGGNASGNFDQSGGTIDLGSGYVKLYASGVYSLSGGNLSAGHLNIGSGGSMAVSGGELSIDSLALQSGGTLDYSGGQFDLTTGGQVVSAGTIDLLGNAVNLGFGDNTFVDLRGTTFENTSDASFTIGNGSYVLVDAGTDLNTLFVGVHNHGVVHVTGTPLHVAQGTGFYGVGKISDPVIVDGFVRDRSSADGAAGAYLNLDGNLTVSSTGSVHIQRVSINGTDSSLNGGSVNVGYFYVGKNQPSIFNLNSGTITSSITEVEAGSTLNMLSGTLRATADPEYQVYDLLVAGAINQTGGDTLVTGDVHVLHGGNYTIQGTGALSASELDVYGQFTQGGASIVNVTSGGISGGLHVGRSYLSDVAHYNMNGGTLNTPILYVGQGANGDYFDQSGGTVNSGDVYLGYQDSTHGYYHLSGDGVLNVGHIYLGQDSRGDFTQVGGTVNVNDSLEVGDGAVANYQLQGGVLNAHIEDVNQTMDQSGGNNTADYLKISGHYQLLQGSLAINSGLKVSGTLNLGNQPIHLQGQNLIVDLSGTISGSGNTSLNLGDHSLLIINPDVNPNTMFSSYSNTGLTHVRGTTLTIATGQEVQGMDDIGDFTQVNGTLAAPASGFINLHDGVSVSSGAHVDLGTGTITATGAGSGISGGQLSADELDVLGVGATFQQTGGQVSLSDLWIGGNRNDSDGTEQYTISGGTLNVAGILSVYPPSFGPGGQTETSLVISGNAQVNAGSMDVNGLGNIDMSGGELTLQGANFTSASLAHFNWTGGTIRVDQDGLKMYDPAGHFFGVNAIDSDMKLFVGRYLIVTNDLNIESGGEVHVANDLIVTGNLTVANGGVLTYGSLEVDGTYQPSGGSVLVQDATLAGGGRLNAALTNQGSVIPSMSSDVQTTQASDMLSSDMPVAVSPDTFTTVTPGSGSSPATLTINGSFTQDSDGVLEIDIAGDSLDPVDGFAQGYGVLNVLGAATLDGDLKVKFLNSFTPSASDVFTILTATSLSGTFANASSILHVTGGDFTVLYGAHTVSLTNFATPTPEPATFGLLFIGVIGLLCYRRHRRVRT